MFCPTNFKPCIDDLCHGGGCLITGEQMYHRCDGCGNLVNDEDTENCTCEPYYDEPEHAAWPSREEDQRLDSPTHNLSNFLNRRRAMK